MEYEGIEDFSNETSNGDVIPEEARQHLIRETILAIVTLMAICANSFIIFVIFRFKKMRTVPNIFLGNWTIANLCSLFFISNASEIISAIGNITLTHEFMCFIHKSGAVLLSTNLLFVLVVGMDWYLAAYFQKTSQKFRNLHKFIIAILWIVALVVFTATITYCITEGVLQAMQFEIIRTVLGIVFIFVIFLHCFKCVRKCIKRPEDYPTLMLALVTAFLGCWSLPFLDVLVVIIVGVDYELLTAIGMCGIYGNSVVTFALLYYFNKDFQACVHQILQRRRNRYEEVQFESQNHRVKPTAEDSLQVSFNPDNKLF